MDQPNLATKAPPKFRLKTNHWSPQEDYSFVVNCLKRKPAGDFAIIVRRTSTGEPVVIINKPVLYDGTPMPTLYWLVANHEAKLTSQLESTGLIKKLNNEINADIINEIHIKYMERRQALIESNSLGPGPRGGVGGTRRGIKCLHAHLANFLVNKEDLIGQICFEQLGLDYDNYYVENELKFFNIKKLPEVWGVKS